MYSDCTLIIAICKQKFVKYGGVPTYNFDIPLTNNQQITIKGSRIYKVIRLYTYNLIEWQILSCKLLFMHNMKTKYDETSVITIFNFLLTSISFDNGVYKTSFSWLCWYIMHENSMTENLSQFHQ